MFHFTAGWDNKHLDLLLDLIADDLCLWLRLQTGRDLPPQVAKYILSIYCGEQTGGVEKKTYCFIPILASGVNN